MRKLLRLLGQTLNQIYSPPTVAALKVWESWQQQTGSNCGMARMIVINTAGENYPQ